MFNNYLSKNYLYFIDDEVEIDLEEIKADKEFEEFMEKRYGKFKETEGKMNKDIPHKPTKDRTQNTFAATVKDNELQEIEDFCSEYFYEEETKPTKKKLSSFGDVIVEDRSDRRDSVDSASQAFILDTNPHLIQY